MWVGITFFWICMCSELITFKVWGFFFWGGGFVVGYVCVVLYVHCICVARCCISETSLACQDILGMCCAVCPEHWAALVQMRLWASYFCGRADQVLLPHVYPGACFGWLPELLTNLPSVKFPQKFSFSQLVQNSNFLAHTCISVSVYPSFYTLHF